MRLLFLRRIFCRDLTVSTHNVVIYSLLTFTDVTGELVRRSIREDQPGVPLDLDIQLIDVNTCEPMVGAYVDVWNCNATVSHLHEDNILSN